MASSSSDTPALAWTTALDRYHEACAAERAYDQLVWSPASEMAALEGEGTPSDVDTEMERLQDARCDAEDAMVEVPAPDVGAVITKIEAYRRRWDGFEWSDDQWGPILADLHRLAGEG